MDFKKAFTHHQAQTTPFPAGIEVDRARGSRIYDKAGKSYIDMIAGVGVNNIGHAHPKVVSAVKEQLNKYMHVMVYGEYVQDAPVRLAVQLTDLLPKHLDCVYFVNSGTEAVEGSLKLAKRITGRSQIISCKKSYHGSTHGSLSVSGNEAKKRAFRPLLPDVRFITHGKVSDLTEITEQTAAVIIEVIQGDGGVRIASDTYLRALRKRCNETGTQLIFDEIQTGFGRTGAVFACDHSGVYPDIMTVGKSLNGGMPGGAFIASREKMELLTHDPALGHITTFGGHPVSCAAGCAFLEVLTHEISAAEVERKGAFLESELNVPEVKEIRRKGLMMAVDLENEAHTDRVIQYCLHNGVLLFRFLSHPYSFRISPPLNISDADLKEAVSVIRDSLTV